MVEGARLESEYTPKAYRGFESLPLRQDPLFLLGKIENAWDLPTALPTFGMAFGVRLRTSTTNLMPRTERV